MYEIKSYTIYSEYYDLITLLSEEEQKDLFYAINKYMFEGIEIALTEKAQKIFNNLKRPLDAAKKKSKNGSNTKAKQEQRKNKTTSNEEQNENKNKSNKNQNEIKITSNENQKEIKTKSKEKTKQQTHQDVYVYVNGNVNVNKLFNEYLALRKENKYTLSETVIKRLKNKLEEFGKTDEDKIEIIQNAINGGWKDFYPLKQSAERKKAPDWYGKEIPEEKASDEEIKELERRLRNG